MGLQPGVENQAAVGGDLLAQRGEALLGQGEAVIGIYNTLPIGLAGMMLCLVGLGVEQPDFAAISTRSWMALTYLGLCASVGGFIVYFFLLKRLSPVTLSFVFIIFPVFAVIIGSWYEGQPISRDLALYSALLLAGFAITKVPVEKLLAKQV